MTIAPDVLAHYRPMAAQFMASMAQDMARTRLTQAEHVLRAAELPAIIADLRDARLELAARRQAELQGK